MDFDLLRIYTQMSLDFSESTSSNLQLARVVYNQLEFWKDLELFNYLGNLVLVNNTNSRLECLNFHMK